MTSGRIAGYNPRRYPPVAVTVDVVLFAIRGDELHVLLIERGDEPFRGCWALPGGFVQPDDEELEAAAVRELAEETGIWPGVAYLEQLGSYGAADRDPRMRVITVAYWAVCSRPPRLRSGSDAASAELVPTAEIESGDVELAFDHERIVADALFRLRAKLEYTAVAARFCGSAFSISELRRVYEVVWGTTLDAGNFQRKVRQNGAFRQVGRREGEDVFEDVVLFRSRPRVLASMALPRPEAFRAADTDEEAEPEIAASLAPSAFDRPLPAADRPRMSAARPRRGGRPPSLWAADDPAVLLDSPIARPAPRDRGKR